MFFKFFGQKVNTTAEGQTKQCPESHPKKCAKNMHCRQAHDDDQIDAPHNTTAPKPSPCDSLSTVTTHSDHSTMKPHSSKKSKRGGGKRPYARKGGGATSFQPRKTAIVFNAEARRDYLTGFSERKRQRRAYGLAMQKVKDRTSRLQEKKQAKQASLQQVEQAEMQKKQLLREKHDEYEQEGDSDDGSDDNETTTNTTTTTRYQDRQTQSMFGGQVIVTTSTLPPSDDDDEQQDSDIDSHSKQQQQVHKNVDAQQRYAGNVNKYLHELQGSMPSKKKHSQKHKGRHGAANMKGMGGASNLKVAQKTLSKVQAKQSKSERKGKRKRH